jgi:hypothetical protein
MSNFWTVGSDGTIRGKQNADTVKDYPINFDIWLLDSNDSYAGNTIESVENITILSNDYAVFSVINNATIAGRYVVVWCQSGEGGVTAKFTIRITTTQGRTETKKIELKIV